MRIAILTQPLRYNYGGILQNFALQTVLRRMGHDVVTLDPCRYKYTWFQYTVCFFRHLVSRYIKGHREVALRGEWLADKSTRILGTNTFKFIDKYIKRREYVDLHREVKKSDYDAFIVGSDQIWRPEYNPDLTNMFLDFTKGWNVRRIAYAASFGTDTWGADEQTTLVCHEGIRQFDLVTVREKSGIELCKALFNVNAQHVLDPTLLLTKDDYIKLLKIDKVKRSSGNLLVYILDYTDDKRLLIEKVSRQYCLTPFRVNSDFEDRSAELDKRVQPSVEQWIRGFYDADYVITDSFHACVFSIIFGRPFVVYGNNDRGIDRFRSLLALSSLEKCLVMRSEEFSGFVSMPALSERIDFERNRSTELLFKCVSS